MAKTHTVSGRMQWQLAILLSVVAIVPFSGAYAHENGEATSKPMAAGTGVEVNIGSNGNVLVRGAKVTSVSGATVNANTSLGSSVLNWIVKTDSETDFTAHKGGSNGIASIAVGDIVSFRGALDQSASGLTVQAKQVKDWSSVETKTKIEGIVSSINTTLNSFTIKRGDATTTVQTNGSTKFTEDGDSASFADIILNAKVKIAGLFSASSSVMTASTVEIDEDGDSNGKHSLRGWFNGGAWLKFWHK